MRVSTSTIYDLNVSAMNQQQANLLNTQLHISSGLRVMTPADDPVAAAHAVSINQSIATNTQYYTTNNNAAQSSLGLSSNALQSVTALLQSAQSTVTQAGNGGLTNSDRQTLATTLQGDLNQLISLANSTDSAGNYLFAGGQGKTQPFTQTANGVSYNGDNTQQLVQVAASLQMPVNDSGANIFMRIKDGNGTFATNAGQTIGVPGSNVMSSATGAVYDYSAATPVAGNNVQTLTGTAWDFSTNNGTFTVGDGTNTATVSLTGNYADSTALLTDINGQLTTQGGNFSAAISNGRLVITNTGATNTPAVSMSATDANVQSLLGLANTAGYAGSATNQNATFSVDGTPVTVNQAVTVAGTGAGAGTLTDALQTALTNAGLTGYTVSPAPGGGLEISKPGSTAPVVISGANAAAAVNGIVNNAGTAGANATSVSNNGTGVISVGGPANPPPTGAQLGNSYQITFSVSCGNTTYSITGTDITGAPLPNANQPGALPSNVPYTSGQTISFNGMQFNIQGAPANGDAFTVTPSTNVSAFKTLSDLITALNTPVAPGDKTAATALNQALSTGLNNLGQAVSNVLTISASEGSRLNQLSSLQNLGSSLNTVFQQNLSQLTNLDYNKAVSDLTQQQVGLQAAQQSFTKVTGLSLFNYM